MFSLWPPWPEARERNEFAAMPVPPLGLALAVLLAMQPHRREASACPSTSDCDEGIESVRLLQRSQKLMKRKDGSQQDSANASANAPLKSNGTLLTAVFAAGAEEGQRSETASNKSLQGRLTVGSGTFWSSFGSMGRTPLALIMSPELKRSILLRLRMSTHESVGTMIIVPLGAALFCWLLLLTWCNYRGRSSDAVLQEQARQQRQMRAAIERQRQQRRQRHGICC
mmetsp:Transcript_81888/g.228174  ORF Transcript_81888/g.228174 Transcript_81888/m.228174 type:complete len:226 (+) Transcript_81888:59-736(+)